MRFCASNSAIMKSLRTAFLIVVLGSSSVWGQTGYRGETDPAEPRVQWDFNVLGEAPRGPFKVEVYYKIFNDGLTYRKVDGEYLAEYAVEIVIYRNGDQIAGTTFDEKYAVESFPRTLSQTDFLLNQINMPLVAPGKYELKMRLRDSKSHQVNETKHSFRISDKDRDWSMTRLEFCRQVEQAADTSQFMKQGLTVVPSVSRTYGNQKELSCPVYAEIYGGPDRAGTSLRLRCEIIDQFSETTLDTSFSIVSQGAVTAVVESFDVSDMSPGQYAMTVRLYVEGKKKPVLDFEEWFEIGWSLSTLLRTNFEGAVSQLKYVASDDEADSLLRTPKLGRAEVWSAFWDRRDPTPGSPLNEYRDEYYRRIRYSNANFSVSIRPGWRTDRGMTYIRYGEPDEVERHPFDLNGYPYNGPWIVWRYFGSNLQFVFVDRRGSGDYDLQHPFDGQAWRRY
jgi:GWxTD domain-containing protein